MCMFESLTINVKISVHVLRTIENGCTSELYEVFIDDVFQGQFKTRVETMEFIRFKAPEAFYNKTV